jgi:NTE family protein
MRAATVSTSRDLAAAREATDLLVLPDVAKVEIRDFSAYDPAVAEGYRATIAALDKLTRPVQALRRRLSIDDQKAIRAAAPAPVILP